MNDELARRLCEAVESLNQNCNESLEFPQCNQVELSSIVAKVKKNVHPDEFWIVQPTIQASSAQQTCSIYMASSVQQTCSIYMARHEPYWAHGDTWEECFEKFEKGQSNETANEKLDPPIPGNESAVS